MKISSKFVVLPALALLLAGCSSQMTPSMTEPTSPNAPDTQETTQGKMPASDMIVDVGLSDYKFDKTEIRAKAGSTITVRLTNNGGMHDFVIDELDVTSKTLNKGGTQEINITIPADAAGKTYEYYCSVMNHRQMGMVGKLIVE